jgi:hypothetical protein
MNLMTESWNALSQAVAVQLGQSGTGERFAMQTLNVEITEVAIIFLIPVPLLATSKSGRIKASASKSPGRSDRIQANQSSRRAISSGVGWTTAQIGELDGGIATKLARLSLVKPKWLPGSGKADARTIGLHRELNQVKPS